MKRLLIITGPQGSGNHLFSRILSTHPSVGGWKSLLEKYWVPSDEEPFAEYWVYPERLTAEQFEGYDYWLANVSCPFFYDGTRHVPKIIEVAERAASFGIDVKIAIITRDMNINREQQLRVRKEYTTPIAQDYYYNTLLKTSFPVHFLSNEALFLHREHYLRYVERTVNFPVDYTNPEIFKFLDQDPNAKYVKHVDEYWLDQEVWHGIQSMSARGLDK
jgi:hypothetical protein